MVQHNELWWDDKIYVYNITAIEQEILENKKRRNAGKVLTDDSYDFVVFVSAYQT
jgi:hypothetical protein